MKPLYLERSSQQNSSFCITLKRYPHFMKIWHYHSELELVVLLKSTGTRFIGDHIHQFNEGELILIGKNLPHMWLNDKVYFEENSSLTASALVVHFKEEFLGKQFWATPEMNAIPKLFERAKRGIKFNGPKINKIIALIKSLEKLPDFKRVLALLNILQELALETDYELLARDSFLDDFKKPEKKKLEPIYNYIMNNFKENISLNDVAALAYMNPSSFSRYFKRVQHKTLKQYINELRVGYACKLLLEKKYSMTDICFESGFNNLSNFNRQFKSVTSFSPSDYLLKRHDSDIKK
ncbi:MAG: AraC family transcriptional regulator [Flavobacteriaceae bacterium]|nr:MAG: AraC family transcriptional regulator [Flavobacteriaceae bacterium]